MTGRRTPIRLITFCALLALAFTASACDHLRDGVNAYYAGDPQLALKILTPIAKKDARVDPVVEIRADAQTRPEEALPSATLERFEGWQAYAGSLLGLGRVDESCQAIELALRPIQVIWNQKPLPQKVDPREGDFWEAEVMTLRSWLATIPCHSDYLTKLQVVALPAP